MGFKMTYLLLIFFTNGNVEVEKFATSGECLRVMELFEDLSSVEKVSCERVSPRKIYNSNGEAVAPYYDYSPYFK